MKYKNIIFDFGNVIGKFNRKYILAQFFPADADFSLLSSAIFRGWDALDAGTADYREYAYETASLLPEALAENVSRFFRDWPRHIVLFDDTLAFINELKEKGIPVYLLSNAPDYFAEWALSNYPFLRSFNGIVFSAPLKMAKPDPAIYRHLFSTFHLHPEECFFIDDLEENIIAAKSLGMNGIVFNGNLDEVKAAL